MDFLVEGLRVNVLDEFELMSRQLIIPSQHFCDGDRLVVVLAHNATDPLVEFLHSMGWCACVGREETILHVF